MAVLLIGGLSAFAVWISGFDVLPEENDPDSSLTIEYQRQTLQIFTCDLFNVKDIHVVNPTGEYRVSRTNEGNVQFLGHEEVPLLPYSSAGLFESVQNIRCEALIETDCTEFYKYGLDDPQATITIEMKDGTEHVFYLGDAAPQGGGYYFRDVTNSDVYLSGTYFSERFLKNHTEYYQKTISKEFEYTGFQSLRITPTGGEEIYVRTTTDEEAKDIRYMGGTIMETPFWSGGDSTPIQSIVEILAALEASEIVTDNLSEENLVKYGFDTPTTVVIEELVDTSSVVSTITGLENPYYDPNGNGAKKLVSSTYVIGKTVDNTTYVMYDGNTVIYAVDKTSLDWAANTVDVYCQRMIYIRYLKELNGLTVEMNGEIYSFSIKDPDAGDSMVVKYNDYTPIDQKQFRNFYRTIIGVTHDGLAYEPPEDTEPYLKITYSAIDGDDIVLAFYQIEARKYVLKVNGEGRFFVYSSKVNKIMNDMFKLLNGEEIMD